ncbi:DUF4292 domain-containing protein [Catalinimonas alkaloidigena]|uniref:DUF4292 domain-containing protein n=1 Tax=Catalinimonas alkaloidigena TaxID=1075417 RepID=UPI001C40AA84|nr:DUF4292 domain-containing protein [Catalinimonas alkaloidigena]
MIGIVLLTGCKKRPTVTDVSALDTTSIGLPLAPALEFTYLTSRAKIAYHGEDQNLNASATIHLRKDSTIWVSISPGLGIEVLRCLITRDSVLAIDRYNRKNYRYDYPALSRKLHFDINYTVLQAALLGNLPYPTLTPAKLKQQENGYVLEQKTSQLMLENFIEGTTGALTRVVAEEMGTRNLLELKYEEYGNVGQSIFPFVNTVLLTSFTNAETKKTEVAVRHQKVDVTETNPGFTFEMPSHYQLEVE